MSKWRPLSQSCLYVIGDIHGQFQQLKLICNRILPLRRTGGCNDKLICLGDYIDRGPKSPEVVDFLIKTKEEYKDQLVLLRGNHEQMLLDAIEPSPTSNKYLMWMKNGGEHTLRQYLEKAGQPMDNPYELPRWRVRDFIPDNHLEFFKNLNLYYEMDDYIFVHGGCDPSVPLFNQGQELLWDRGLFEFAMLNTRMKRELPWDKPIITGHNGMTERSMMNSPFINEKFMMLDISHTNRLLVAELNSMEAFIAGNKKAKMVKIQLTETMA